jgi:hypothetical protein
MFHYEILAPDVSNTNNSSGSESLSPQRDGHREAVPDATPYRGTEARCD